MTLTYREDTYEWIVLTERLFMWQSNRRRSTKTTQMRRNDKGAPAPNNIDYKNTEDMKRNEALKQSVTAA